MQQDYPELELPGQERTTPQENLYASVNQDERIRNVISQTSPDNQLVDLQWRLKGYIKDPYSQVYKKIEKNAPEPSPLLISRYVSFLSSLLNDNVRMANYSPIEINRIMDMCIEFIRDDLDDNAEAYGLTEDYTERTRIGLLILNHTFAILKRSQDGKEASRIFRGLQMVENLSPSNEPKKNWFTGILK